MNQLLTKVNTLLEKSGFSWAICGGFALDMFLGKEIRKHSDIDICVFENDREKILLHMFKNKWDVYEFRGNGKVRPLSRGLLSESGRNLMCIDKVCEIVKFYPCDEEGLLWYEFFHTGISELDYIEFLFNTTTVEYFIFDEGKGIKRGIKKAVLYHEDVPYLAPEIVLLYKSSCADRVENNVDFEQTYPRMNDEQKEWFLRSLNILYPNGHKWSNDSK